MRRDAAASIIGNRAGGRNRCRRCSDPPGRTVPIRPPLTSARSPGFRTDIAWCFQSFNLFHHLNVLKNLIEAPIGVLGWSRDKAIDRARDLLRRGRPAGEGRVLPEPSVGRTAAADRDCPRADDGAVDHVV